MLLLIFFLVLQGYNKMKSSKVSYQNIKQKMKFGNQELSVLTNEFHYPSREAMFLVSKKGHNLCLIQFLYSR